MPLTSIKNCFQAVARESDRQRARLLLPHRAGGPGDEEESDANNIVLMRHGAFSRHFGRRTVTADVNQAVFFSKESTYRVSHPSDCGDRGTVFTVSPRVLNDIVRELDPSIDEHPDQPFRFVTGPCDSSVFWRHRELVQRLGVSRSRIRSNLVG